MVVAVYQRMRAKGASWAGTSPVCCVLLYNKYGKINNILQVVVVLYYINVYYFLNIFYSNSTIFGLISIFFVVVNFCATIAPPC